MKNCHQFVKLKTDRHSVLTTDRWIDIFRAIPISFRFVTDPYWDLIDWLKVTDRPAVFSSQCQMIPNLN